MSCGAIYKIQFPNGKHYIGLTTISLEHRRSQHKNLAKSDDTKYLYNALRKYDMVDTFELIEIDTADTLEELCEMEIRYIQEYKSYYIDGCGYNMTYGGDGTNGYVFTEEDKQKISEALKKHHEDNPDTREKMSEISKKRWENPDTREKMSKITKKRWENPEERQKCSEALKKHFEENPNAGKKHSERMKKHFENPEARQKCSEALKKRFENPEARQKHGESQKERFENPEERQKHSESQKKRFKNPEEIQKMSEAHKKHHAENPNARRKTLDRKGQNKPFDVFTADGTFIKTFTYHFEAKEYLQKEHHITSTIKIGSVLNGMQKISAGFVFKYM